MDQHERALERFEPLPEMGRRYVGTAEIELGALAVERAMKLYRQR